MRWGLGALAALATLSGARAADPPSSGEAARYAGYYFAAPSVIVKLEARDGALLAHADGQPNTTYAPEGDGKFFASANNTHIAFQTNPDGLVTGAVVTQGSGPPIPARRVTEAEAVGLAGGAVDPRLAAYASMKDSARLTDGRVIHMVCMGQGSPTVILTAGAGGWGIVWDKVQPAIAKKTRACAWDRAGYGLSDLSPQPQTIDNTTTDLEAALKAAHIDGPYVAVGHSLGGLESLLLKDRQPRNVVGMVLVDPTLPGQGQRAPLAPNAAPFPEPPGVALFHKCAAALRAGTVRAGAPDPDGCLRGQSFPSNYPPSLRAALDKHPADLPAESVARGFDFLAASASPQWLLEDTQIALKPGRSYGNMPLVVLTAGELPPPPPGQAPFPEARAALDQFRRGHDAMAAFSTRGVNRVVEGSSHNIQQIKPQVVIDSIDEVVDEARADMAKSGKTARR